MKRKGLKPTWTLANLIFEARLPETRPPTNRLHITGTTPFFVVGGRRSQATLCQYFCLQLWMDGWFRVRWWQCQKEFLSEICVTHHLPPPKKQICLPKKWPFQKEKHNLPKLFQIYKAFLNGFWCIFTLLKALYIC